MRTSSIILSIIFGLLAACGGEGKDSGNNQADPITLEQYDANMAEWNCRMYIDCCGQDQMLLGLHGEYSDYESCLAGETGAIISDGQDYPSVVLNEELVGQAWQAHLAYYGTGCATIPDPDQRAAYQDIMDRLYTGQLGVNEECVSSMECQAGLWCDYYSGTCAALPGEGEACDWTGCGVGAACVDGLCVEDRALGETCRGNLYAPCPDKYESLTCDTETNTCVLRYPLGAPCVSSRECRSQSCGNDHVCITGTETVTNEEEWCMDEDPF